MRTLICTKVLYLGMEDENENSDETVAADGDVDNKVYIVPTSHASDKSSERVRETVNKVSPDAIAIELDRQRLEKLKKTRGEISDKSAREVWSNSKGAGLKGRMILVLFSTVQSKVASKLGMDLVGQDMLTGYDLSEEKEIPLALVDRDIDETFKSFSSEVSNIQMVKMLIFFVLVYLKLKFTSGEDLSENVSLEQESEGSQNGIDIQEAIDALEDALPSAKRVIIDERDQYIASGTIQVAKSMGDTVLVIGAAHEPGVREALSESDEIDVIERAEMENLESSEETEEQKSKEIN